MKKKYSESAMQKALKEIEDGATKRSAAMKYGIPWSTIQRRSTRFIHNPGKPGGEALKISENMEKTIADWIVKSSKEGQKVTKTTIALYIKENFNEVCSFSNDWCKTFLKRNPEIGNLVDQSDRRHLRSGQTINSKDGVTVKIEDQSSDQDDSEDEQSDNSFSESLLNGDKVKYEDDSMADNIKFAKNESSKVALCFACGKLIDSDKSKSGLKCGKCFRKYHFKCANKQYIKSCSTKDLFVCLVCWNKSV